MPAKQYLKIADPVVSVYWPGCVVLQSPWPFPPVLSKYVPLGHGVQAVDPEAEYVPKGHTVQSEGFTALFPKYPALHCVVQFG